MRKAALLLAISVSFFAACHTITEMPTQPNGNNGNNNSSGTLSVPLPFLPGGGSPGSPTPAPSGSPTPRPSATPTPAPGATPTPGPGPTPTPTPVPTPTPSPTPTPDPGVPNCPAPVPGPVAKMDVKIHIYGANRLVLDTTALVGPDAEYCKKIGYTDGRRYCPSRQEGSPELYGCDGYLVGVSPDTGRMGPTWTRNGMPCTSWESLCDNHEDNQFLVSAYGPGTYTACTQSGVCGSLTIP